jgi:RimJ/RimL family protein N-acetyltransferase
MIRRALNQSVAALPQLETERLILRPLTPQDAPAFSRLAGQREIADTTISIPHPYSEEQARQWIAGNVEIFAKGNAAVFEIKPKIPIGYRRR